MLGIRNGRRREGGRKEELMVKIVVVLIYFSRDGDGDIDVEFCWGGYDDFY